MNNELLAQADPEISAAIHDELTRQRNTLELIASENIPSLPVIETMGTILTNKYAEGYPGKRYYGGCANVDTIETIARNRACEVFGAAYANVQPHSGVCANSAAYFALLEPGAKILGMSLPAGGHLSHGAKFSLSGRFYDAHSYGLNPETERIDMDEVRAIAREVKPDLIVAGASAYPRIIDFEAFADIAHEVGAYLMVDMAHIAGLVAGGAHPSPVPFADIVTSTSHKTLRGPRGGFMVTNSEEVYEKYNKAVFPGWQGGPLMHVIAAKAVAFGEAAQPAFSEYAHAVVENAAALGEGLVEGGLRLVSGGTDNHLCLVDLTPAGITGKDAEALLEPLGITTNKNAIPNDPLPTTVTSGVRVGSATITSRGFDAEESRAIGGFIAHVIFNRDDQSVLDHVARDVHDMLEAHPLYPEIA
ncbi:MAG: serine hydroxymethyltransferase [Coriobacteriales bacterium]